MVGIIPGITVRISIRAGMAEDITGDIREGIQAGITGVTRERSQGDRPREGCLLPAETTEVSLARRQREWLPQDRLWVDFMEGRRPEIRLRLRPCLRDDSRGALRQSREEGFPEELRRFLAEEGEFPGA